MPGPGCVCLSKQATELLAMAQEEAAAEAALEAEMLSLFEGVGVVGEPAGPAARPAAAGSLAGSMDSGGSGGAGAAEAGAAVAPPPLKRRKSGQRAPVGAGSSGAAGGAAQPQDAGGQKRKSSRGSAPEDAEQVVALEGKGESSDLDKKCVGCGRSPQDQDFLSGQRLAWALPPARGSWCAACFGCWRSVYSSRCTLMMMHTVLSDRRHRQEFERLLAAWLSLRREGYERLTENQVMERAASISYVLKLMCIPEAPVVVTDLQTAVAQLGLPLEASRLCSILRQQGGTSVLGLGYMADAASLMGKTSTPQSLQRPQDLSFQGGLPSRSHLLVGDDADHAVLATAFGDIQDPAASSQGPPDRGCLVSGKAGDMQNWGLSSKLSLKVSTALQHAGTHVARFTEAAWENLTPGFASAAQSKLHAARGEAAVADGWLAVTELDRWSKVLIDMKQFLTRHKELRKAKRGSLVDKLQSLREPLESFVSFMKAEHLQPHAGVMLLLFKAGFLASPADNYRLGSSFNDMLSQGLEHSLQQESQQAGFVLHWVRSLLLVRLAALLRALDCDKLEIARCRFLEAFEELERTFRDRPCFEKDRLELVEDAACLQVFFRAAGAHKGIQAKTAEQAELRLSSPAFSQLKEALEESSAGQEYMSGIQTLNKRATEDLLGDKRFAEAEKGAADPSGLHVVLRDDVRQGAAPEAAVPKVVEVRHGGLCLCAEGKYWVMAREILDFAEEALRVWSRLRAEERLGDLLTVLKAAVRSAWGAQAAAMVELHKVALKCAEVLGPAADADGKPLKVVGPEAQRVHLNATGAAVAAAWREWPWAQEHLAEAQQQSRAARDVSAWADGYEAVVQRLEGLVAAAELQQLLDMGRASGTTSSVCRRRSGCCGSCSTRGCRTSQRPQTSSLRLGQPPRMARAPSTWPCRSATPRRRCWRRRRRASSECRAQPWSPRSQARTSW